MAISTFGTLKTAILNHLHRSDLDSVAADFVALAEAQIARDVRLQSMETSATGTLSSSQIALPTGFLEVIRLLVGGKLLDQVTQEQFARVTAGAQCYQFTIIGSNIELQGSSGDYDLLYFKRYTALSADGDTTTLLTDYPDVYLYASLGAAADYIGADRNRWDALYQRSLAAIRRSDQRHRYGGQLVVRPDVVVI